MLDSLDQRIVAALQVDGRAAWRAIAAVLGEAERTVARRGSRLLAEGLVEVHGLADPHLSGRGEPFMVRLRAAPSSAWAAASALAARPEVVVSYIVSGGPDCVVDIWCPRHRRSDLFLHELAAVPGMTSCTVAPIFRYVSTLHDWNPGILSEDEVAALRPYPVVSPWPALNREPATLTRDERIIIRALTDDGRLAYEELGRLVGASEQTARRRVGRLRASGLLTIRAVVDPGLLGLPVGGLLWMKLPPRHVPQVSAALSDSRYVRYGAVLGGEHQLVADVRMPSTGDLHEFITTAPWLADVDSLDTLLILDVLKQGDVLARRLRPEQDDLSAGGRHASVR